MISAGRVISSPKGRPNVDHRINPVLPGVATLLKSLAASFGDVPALVWQLDVRKNELTFLNEPNPVLSDRIALILKNPAHARASLVPEDRERFFKCFDKIRAAQPAATIVRVRENGGVVRWIALMARPEPGATSRCLGLIAEVSGLAELVLGSAWEAGLEEKIALFDFPVLLFDFRTKRLAHANGAARQFLGGRLTDPAGLAFDDLMSRNVATASADIFEGLIFGNQWTGSLVVADDRDQPRTCAAKVHALAHHNEHLLWISLVPSRPDDDNEADDGYSSDLAIPAAADGALDHADSIKAVLQAFLDHQPQGVRADGALRSRIFGSENRVVVTGAGEPFLTMPMPETFPYEGSIAENIVRFGLDHLIVEDTSRSIKPIDWVLFIPKGIRSYFAKPFFENGVLKNVFIVCSTEAGRFTERNVRGYGPFFSSVQQAFDRLEEFK
jgi:hypothetical protein